MDEADGLPPEERFRGLEGRDALEALRRSRKGEYKNDNGKFYKDTKKIIPTLVKENEPRSFQDAVERRLLA